MTIRDSREVHLAYMKAYRDRPENKIKHRAAIKTWGEKNKQHLRAYQNNKKLKKKLRAIEYLGGECSHCTQKVHHAAYDFHHVNPEEKEMVLGTLLHYRWERIEVELKKCILLCSNCHRVHHYEENKNNEDSFEKKQRKATTAVGRKGYPECVPRADQG